ncbi:MAG: class I SAM-dependent methyltransferase [Kiloniellales bacterium]
MKREDYVAANRAAWEEVAPLHRSQNQARLLEAFRRPGHSWFGEIETAVLNEIGVAGKAMAQLCCNNGRELLSVKNMGAGRCVGFEQAEGFIAQARELAAAGGIDCDFVCGDVHAIPAEYDGAFDLVFITIGVLSWMPDLGAFMAVPARLLAPGGQFLIYEEHPIVQMIAPGKADDPVVWESSYFREAPFVDSDGLDYYGHGAYEAKPNYCFLHKLSDIVTACLDSGLAIEHFVERPEHISNTYYNVETQGPRLPMSYTLIARKAA